MVKKFIARLGIFRQKKHWGISTVYDLDHHGWIFVDLATSLQFPKMLPFTLEILRLCKKLFEWSLRRLQKWRNMWDCRGEKEVKGIEGGRKHAYADQTKDHTPLLLQPYNQQQTHHKNATLFSLAFGLHTEKTRSKCPKLKVDLKRPKSETKTATQIKFTPFVDVFDGPNEQGCGKSAAVTNPHSIP